MPTGLPALELAIIIGLIFAAVVWQLERKIPPEPGAAEQAWRSGWLTRFIRGAPGECRRRNPLSGKSSSSAKASDVLRRERCMGAKRTSHCLRVTCVAAAETLRDLEDEVVE